jgi:prepilin peptidase CpaA
VLALLGIGCSLLVYIPLYLVRGMGAGDVKLMAAVGAIAGPRNWLGIFLATAILGGIVSFVYVLSRKRLQETLLNLSVIVNELVHVRAPVIRDPNLDIRSAGALRMPHGALIAVGVVTFLIFGSRFLSTGG